MQIKKAFFTATKKPKRRIRIIGGIRLSGHPTHIHDPILIGHFFASIRLRANENQRTCQNARKNRGQKFFHQ
jgi:hypothetical protein